MNKWSKLINNKWINGENLEKLNKLTADHQSTIDGHETRLVNYEERVVSLEKTAVERSEELKVNKHQKSKEKWKQKKKKKLKAIEDRSAARHEEITARLNHVSAYVENKLSV